MPDITALLDKALVAVDEYLNAGAQGRQERAIAAALDNVIDAIRELAPKAKAAPAPKSEPAKAPAKKAPAKKAAGKHKA